MTRFKTTPIVRSDFVHEIVGDVLCIEDLNQGGMSVTNDADNVIMFLRQRLGELPKYVIYKDSDGNWDQIIPISDTRVYFRSICSSNRKDRQQAILTVKRGSL